MESKIRTLILFSWVILRYSNDSSREYILPYCYFFNILRFKCGPGCTLTGIGMGVLFWEKNPDSATVTRFCFLLLNNLLIKMIYMKVKIMTWKEGCICGKGWVWVHWSMEHRNLPWRCGSFVLSLGFPSGWIMRYGILSLI